MCSSPKLFAAYHVFHRLSVPRHPPCALLCLTSLVPPSPSGKEGCLPSALAYAAVGCMSSHASFSSVQALRLPGPELAFVLGESVCSYRIRTFRILDVVFSWNLIKKTFTVCSFQGTIICVSHLRFFFEKNQKRNRAASCSPMPSPA